MPVMVGVLVVAGVVRIVLVLSGVGGWACSAAMCCCCSMGLANFVVVLERVSVVAIGMLVVVCVGVAGVLSVGVSVIVLRVASSSLTCWRWLTCW